jgi:hypothetical protein
VLLKVLTYPLSYGAIIAQSVMHQEEVNSGCRLSIEPKQNLWRLFDAQPPRTVIF